MSVTKPDGTVISYDHDQFGRRIVKRINGVVAEKYLWKDAITLLAVYDGNNNLISRFNYADGRLPVSITSGSSTYYLAYDQVGSLRVITDSNGSSIKRIDYDSFGNILLDTNPIFAVPFGFAGGLHDKDTGLVRFGLRDSDPAIGRWTAKDPIDFAGRDENLFAYVGNNPVNWIDPWGLEYLRPPGSPSISPYYFGRTGSGIEPGGALGSYLENHVTHAHQTAKIHDRCVDTLNDLGVPDIFANYPTMIPAFGAAVIYNNLTDYSQPKQNYFIIFQLNW